MTGHELRRRSASKAEIGSCDAYSDSECAEAITQAREPLAMAKEK
jgi:hypothetical protein